MTTYVATDRADAGPLAKIVLKWGDVTERIVAHDAKQPGFNEDGWAEIRAMVDVDKFERVGAFLEVVTWAELVETMTHWAITSQWERTLKRITQIDRTVFQELEERSEHGGESSVVNSFSVYQFDENDKIVHLDIYLQMKPSAIEMARSSGFAEADA